MNWDFQKYDLCLEWAEEQRSNCKHSLEHGERKGIQKSICFCFIDYTKCFDCGYNKKLCTILKEMGISDHLTCFLKNLLASQEAPVRTGHGSPVHFSRSVEADSLWPHELQHARPPSPSPIPGAFSDSCSSSRWFHPTISFSVIPFSSHLQPLPASGSFPMSQFLSSGDQNIGA